ncbi:hypothetical protein RMSM_06970 [Rhodopirellula maiorica SM1]|uniref:Uncharacterized protein n=1 Tax=Rhodopirellula maiorica SM1 TaxID=1265738 RepID=M5RAL3_9BACT|nr:hypothetical protein RMSM_06970 [Rhodopirellula maiorica SM1]
MLRSVIGVFDGLGSPSYDYLVHYGEITFSQMTCNKFQTANLLPHGPSTSSCRRQKVFAKAR